MFSKNQKSKNNQDLKEQMESVVNESNNVKPPPSDPIPQNPSLMNEEVHVQETSNEPVVGDQFTGKPKSTHPVVVNALQVVKQYVIDMDPKKPQNIETLKKNQVALALALYSIMSTEDNFFKETYTELLTIVKENINGVFSAINRNRGLNDVAVTTLDNVRMNFFTRMVDLMALTAEGKGVENVKRHFDFGRLLDNVKNPVIKRNLTGYYSI